MIKKFFKKHFKEYNPRAKKMLQFGVGVREMFANSMNEAGIDWWLEFGTVAAEFKGVKVRIPDNVEEHLIEIYGSGYKVYDPLFKEDFNKKDFEMSERQGIGFRKGLPE